MSKHAPFDKPKHNGMRHPKPSKRLKGTPPASLGFSAGEGSFYRKSAISTGVPGGTFGILSWQVISRM